MVDSKADIEVEFYVTSQKLGMLSGIGRYTDKFFYTVSSCKYVSSAHD